MLKISCDDKDNDKIYHKRFHITFIIENYQ